MHFANRVISNHSYVFAGRPVRIVAGRSADSLAKFLEEEIDETITSVPGIGPAAAKKLEAGDDGVSTARRDSAALFFSDDRMAQLRPGSSFLCSVLQIYDRSTSCSVGF